MYFRHKHVETGPNRSYELATFLKYHMPLRVFEIWKMVAKIKMDVDRQLLALKIQKGLTLANSIEIFLSF